MDIQKHFTCVCGDNTIALSFGDNMPAAVVDKVYCPHCQTNGHPHNKGWPIPGDWFLHFDMEVARMFIKARLDIDPMLVNPGFIMDGGYVR